MSLALGLLDNLAKTYLVNPELEPHIVIDTERNIHVPEKLKRIAVERDHNIETVVFDAPRYWDGIDLSAMYIYVNYVRADKTKGQFLCKNVRIDEKDQNIMHFDWTLEEHATLVKGKLRFLVCAQKTGTDGKIENHWNSELNEDMHVSEGLECEDFAYDMNPAIITDLLTRMDHILLANDPLVLDTSLTEAGLAAEAKAAGDAIKKLGSDIREEIDDFAEDVEVALRYLTTYNTPQMFGAIGDGVEDDTRALKAAFNGSKDVYLPAGTYITNEPLYVNVNKMTLTGSSSRSVIKAGDDFPEGEAIITFYSPGGNYEDREKRENRHGSFSVIGKNQTCDGVRIGGAVGTEYEGSVEASIFSNIMVVDCNVAYLWGAHAYRDTLFQCDSKSNVYSLKTADDITDSGEVFTCINCGFWSGALYLTCGCYFYGCTVHIHVTQTVPELNESCAHYLNNGYYAFQNCHFEAILRTDEECNEVRPPFLLAHNASVVLNNCDGIISAKYITYNDCAIKTISTSGNGLHTNVDIIGGSYKYMLARMKFASEDAAMTRGNVNLEGIGFKYTYDGTTLDTNIYEDSTWLRLNRQSTFDEIVGLSDNNRAYLNLQQSYDTEYRQFFFTIKEWQQNPHIGFYRKLNVGNHKALRVKGSVTSNRDDLKHHINSNEAELSLFIFLDKYGDPISPLTENDQYMSYDKNLEVNKVIAIPHGCTDILVGFDVLRGGGIASGDYVIYTNLIYELL